MGCGGCQGGKVRIDLPPVTSPVMNQEGAIEYPEGHDIPEIQGYHADPENDRVLIPDDGVGCDYRIAGILMQRDGSYKPHFVCRHTQCEHKSKPVTMDICKGCPFRNKVNE